MTDARGDVFAAIDRERRYQDAKWGTVDEHPHTVGEWLLILESELNEAKEAWVKWDADADDLHEILQVAAVAVACMEQHEPVERADIFEYVAVPARRQSAHGETMAENRDRGTCREHDRPIEAVFLCLACEDERWIDLKEKCDYHADWNRRHIAEKKRLRQNIESLEKQVEISIERRDELRAACERALEHVTDALIYPDDDDLVVELRKALRQ